MDKLKLKVANWPNLVITIMAGVSAFGAYTSMYSFRKAYTAATFSGMQFMQVDYKVWLVITQIIGYTISKFIGIRYIAEVTHQRRAISVLSFIAVAWLALLGFALVPAPYNIIFLFINGLPLGMIWGLIFGYLEGRRTTEFMAAVMSISLIFASGFVKTVGRTLIGTFHITELWMLFNRGYIVLPCCYLSFASKFAPS